MDLEALKNIIRGSVEYFNRTHFIPNPYDYLYESDIQAHLFAILREDMRRHGDSGSRGIPCTMKQKGMPDTVDLNLIYTEYAWRIDLVCLNPENAVRTTDSAYKSIHPKPKSESLWDQPLIYGIELKYSMTTKRCGLNHCMADFKKLKQYQTLRKEYSPGFGFMVLCFVQDEGSFDEIEKEAAPGWTPASLPYQDDSIYFIAREGIFRVTP